MTNAKPSLAVRLFPSLRDVAFLAPLAVIFARPEGVSSLLEGDTGWHIRTGEWILANRAVPRVDLFSFTKPGEPWFAWEWLWDVLFAWLHQQAGMAAVIFASILVLCVTSTLLFKLVSRKCGHPVLAIGLTVAAVIGGSIHWYARPHLFTLLFTVVFLSILDRAAGGRPKLLWWLPALTVLWTNLHGGFLAGLLLLAAYLGGSLLAAALAMDARARQAQLRAAGRYALTAAGCLVATLANPYGWHLHAHIANYLTESYHREHITEFRSISFHLPLVPVFEAVLLLGVMVAAWYFWRRQFAATFLLLGWAHLALLMARNIPIFLVVAAPLVAAALEEWLALLARAEVPGWLRRAASSFAGAGRDFASLDRLPRFMWLSAGAAALLFALLTAPATPPRLTAAYDAERYPVEAVAALEQLGVSRTYTDDEWGDYLIYRRHPEQKVFVDGRSDFYGPEFGKSFLQLLNGEYTWRREFGRWDIDSVMLPVKSSLAATLKESQDWQVRYDDGVAIVFTPRLAEPQVSIVSVRNGVERDREIAKTSNGGQEVARPDL